VDINEINHIDALLTRRRANLRRLEIQAAAYGSSNVPIRLQNEIDAEQDEVERLQSRRNILTGAHSFPDSLNNVRIPPRAIPHVVELGSPRQDNPSVPRIPTPERQYRVRQSIPQTHDVDEEDEEDPTEPASLGGIILTLGFVALIVWSIYSIVSYNISFKFYDDFPYYQSLGVWKSTGVATIVNNGRTKNTLSTRTITETASVSYTTDGAVELRASPRAFIYHSVSEKSLKGKVYSAKVWCKAPIGASCRIFLGDIQQGINLPFQENSQTISREGTDNWESMEVSFEADQEAQMYVFLYAEGHNDAVLFDDVEVRVLN
jgi:hypothetical protein